MNEREAETSLQGQFFNYLASPYSNPLPATREWNYEAAVEAGAWLFQRGILIYGPIQHWHWAAKRYDMPTDAATYWRNNEVFLAGARNFILLKLPSWDKSKGVAQELAYARARGMGMFEMTIRYSDEFDLRPLACQ